ncbi:MAG: diguanylate cyclase, partial [Gammaproteobacteria bacterium]|nr:diguanylate cyclase [Gammaproteobacteria bacterium]
MSKDYSVDVGKIDDVDQQNGQAKVMKRVLVVDDEESIRDMLTEVLVAEKYEVVQAPSGEEALDLFRDNPFPLVITDIRMGGMNGFELLGEIKQLAAETHVVIMTSHASMDSAITALKSDAYDYIIKPLEDLRLITNVARRAIENFALIKERKSLMENLKNSNERLEELAIRDGLTGLYNHRHLYDALTREVARATRFNVSLSVIFLDVDFFKKYNDTYGHQSGDQLLKAISQILLDNIRRIDIAARYGGEEFV